MRNVQWANAQCAMKVSLRDGLGFGGTVLPPWGKLSAKPTDEG